ncbi:MAG: DUF3568 family protein [Planctomycetes bacterium]|nr:DUF3568 family protein [Planctomycetota bacterium]MBI3844869.1 DUF3568 family protein [Planctomycetota bacterium]
MRSTFAGILALASLVFTSSGCLFVAGAAVAAGAIVYTGDDSIEATLDKPFDVVYDASMEELKRRGSITVQSREFGKLEADVVVPNDAHVEVGVERVGNATVKLTVKARKLAKTVPDQKTAEAIGNNIIQSVSGKK